MLPQTTVWLAANHVVDRICAFENLTFSRVVSSFVIVCEYYTTVSCNTNSVSESCRGRTGLISS